jgi:homoserine dehydrogenase
MILAALVFNRPLTLEQVRREGITQITRQQVQAAADAGQRIKLIALLQLHPGAGGRPATLEASVQPTALTLSDPLARVDGAMNAITIHADTLSSVTIIGPGAGGIETAQGLLADVLACVSMEINKINQPSS